MKDLIEKAMKLVFILALVWLLTGCQTARKFNDGMHQTIDSFTYDVEGILEVITRD